MIMKMFWIVGNVVSEGVKIDKSYKGLLLLFAFFIAIRFVMNAFGQMEMRDGTGCRVQGAGSRIQDAKLCLPIALLCIGFGGQAFFPRDARESLYLLYRQEFKKWKQELPGSVPKEVYYAQAL